MRTGDKDVLKMSDLSVGHPLITRLARLSEAKTRAISWITKDIKQKYFEYNSNKNKTIICVVLTFVTILF